MDHIKELGSLGLASRIRRLLERLTRDGNRAYQALGVDFQVSWFAVFHLLAQRAPLSITELASSLGQSHPTIIQVVDEMTSHNLLQSSRDPADGRRRRIELTPGGRELAGRLQPIWKAFEEAGQELATEEGNDFLLSLAKIEAAIERKSPSERITQRIESLAGDGSHD